MDPTVTAKVMAQLSSGKPLGAQAAVEGLTRRAEFGDAIFLVTKLSFVTQLGIHACVTHAWTPAKRT